jgi:hypothetical protein
MTGGATQALQNKAPPIFQQPVCLASFSKDLTDQPYSPGAAHPCPIALPSQLKYQQLPHQAKKVTGSLRNDT